MRDQLMCRLCFSTATGAAIAPPPSLTENTATPSEPPAKVAAVSLGPGAVGGGSLAGLGIAAKIMAKYGYKVKYLLIPCLTLFLS